MDFLNFFAKLFASIFEFIGTFSRSRICNSFLDEPEIPQELLESNEY